MATAAPHVKLLRQLSKAKDDYMSGAFDIAWDGGSATIFMVFGQPSHAVFESGGTRLDGEPALDALFRELPSQFNVGDWRRAMSPQETLSISVDDITEPLAELVGQHAVVTIVEDVPSWLSADDDSPDLGFDLDSFPLLPEGPVLWPAMRAEDVALSQRLSSLQAALVVLTGPRLRAAGIVRAGDLIDAVWVDSADHARGETAAMALLGARDGQLAAFALENGQVAEALPLLWRLPHGERIDTAWVDGAGLIAAMQSDNDDHALIVDGPQRAVGLFGGGALIATYTSRDPIPTRSATGLIEALQFPGTAVRVLQRAARLQAHPIPRVVVRDAPATAPPPAVLNAPEPAEHVSPVETPAFQAAEQMAAPAFQADHDAAPTAAFVDFDSVREELVALAVHWLGERDAAPVVERLLRTGPTIDEFTATIGAIREMTIPGQEHGAILAMARDMHLHAAERLCGA
jgi:hypothetical protein